MAASDLSSYKDDPRVPKTADQTVTDYGTQINDVQNAQAAATAGVKDAAYIDYNVALKAYEDRSDVESLADRRKRDFPATFADGDLMRQSPTAYASTVKTSGH